MIRFGSRAQLVEYIDESPEYLQLVADRHGIERFLSEDGLRWNVVLPLPSIDVVLVYVAPVAAEVSA